ncbi:MAG: ATP phosphoribosyltransferase regulatory subunit [Clostridia bacterium]|nr:ATP phosphoribosyltransferase regulatory subunit [Clostridia bacterium]
MEQNQYNESDLLTMTREEFVAFHLRRLYNTYGYTQYKMNKFEEYDLYVRNKSFLVSDNIITFTDHTGRLLALKPDVTLSIIKSGRDTPGKVSRIYYNENVYRTAPGSRDFREITQVGLECIGELDTYLVSEVLTLAAQSLKRAGRHISFFGSPDYLLEISHLDVVACLLDGLGVDDGVKARLLTCIGEKNAHDVGRICREEGVDAAHVEALQTLVATDGAPDEVLPVLNGLAESQESLRGPVQELSRTVTALPASVKDKVRIDFSLLSDMTYYNGIVFRGYIKGIPDSVLSGGRYDRLMRKMGRTSDAIGFAVYLDRLAGYYTTAPSDRCYDTVLLYDGATDPGALSEAMAACAEGGERAVAVRALPEELCAARVIDMRGDKCDE